jgi:hypothetical protein
MPSHIGRKAFVTSRLSSPVLSFTNVANNSLTVNWTTPANAALYHIERSTSSSFSTSIIIYTGALATFNDNTLSTNTQYYYRVTAYAIGFIDSFPTVSSIITTNVGGGGATLATPTLTKIAVGKTSASVRSSVVSNADGYIFQRANDSGFTSGVVTISINTDDVEISDDIGLTAGTTYYYRCRAVDTTHTNADSPYSSVVSITTNTQYRIFDIVNGAGDGGVIMSGDPTSNFWYGYFDPSTFQIYRVQAGDTIKIHSGFAYSYISMDHFAGTPTERLTIINEGNVALSAGFDLRSMSNFRLTGLGTKTSAYGWSITGSGGSAMELHDLSYNAEIDNFYTDGCLYGMRLKNEVGDHAAEADCGRKYWWPKRMYNVHIHHFECYRTGQDVLYIGSSDPYGQFRSIFCDGNTIIPRPLGLKNIEIDHFTLAFAGRSGVQIGTVDQGYIKVHDFNISNMGNEWAVDQGAGFAIGGATQNVEIYNGTVDKTWRQGLYSYHYGQLTLHDVSISNTGIIDISSGVGIFSTKLQLDSGQHVDPALGTNVSAFIQAPGNEYRFRLWETNVAGNYIIFLTQQLVDSPTKTPAETLSTYGQTAVGSHDGSQGNPYAGFGANTAIRTSQISLPSTARLPYDVEAIMFNPYAGNRDPLPLRVSMYNVAITNPTGRAITFLDTTNNYDPIYNYPICNVTFNGLPLPPEQVAKAGGASNLTYTITASC